MEHLNTFNNFQDEESQRYIVGKAVGTLKWRKTAMNWFVKKCFED